MLRKRSRSKQSLMAETGGSLLRSPTQKQSKVTPFPKLFTAFSGFKSFIAAENDAVASPTSILDTKPFSVLKNPFWSDNPKTHEPETRLKFDRKGIGLAIVDSLVDEENPESGFSRPGTRTILFGSQLRIQIPDSPRSPADFGIKTRNSYLGSFSSPPETKKPGSGSGQDSPRFFTGHLSASEMELSEDYTCVISHGPNPRTIHIFDNYILESPYGVVFPGSDQTPESGSGYCSRDSFLSCCYTCKKNLGHGKDIFMYRGEKAFCSSECRSQEMMLEEENIK